MGECDATHDAKSGHTQRYNGPTAAAPTNSLLHQQPNVIVIGCRKHCVDPDNGRLGVCGRDERRFLLLL